MNTLWRREYFKKAVSAVKSEHLKRSTVSLSTLYAEKTHIRVLVCVTCTHGVPHSSAYTTGTNLPNRSLLGRPVHVGWLLAYITYSVQRVCAGLLSCSVRPKSAPSRTQFFLRKRNKKERPDRRMHVICVIPRNNDELLSLWHQKWTLAKSRVLWVQLRKCLAIACAKLRCVNSELTGAVFSEHIHCCE